MSDFIEKNYNESLERNNIDNSLYDKYNVKKGLRNANGTGVLVLLTKIAEVHGYKYCDGVKVDDEGHLYFRGYDLYELEKRTDPPHRFESVCFLLLFGRFPNEKELEQFIEIISNSYRLPSEFLENNILKNTSRSVMNQIQRSVLCLYSYDNDPDNINPEAMLVKGLDLLAKMPAIICYSYQAKKHYIDNLTLHIRHPRSDYSIAENILYMTRKDGKFTKVESDTLDLMLMIQADHGGGNNSTFTSVVVSSTGTDIYSSISASLGSLKGPRHGGANKEVGDMMHSVIYSVGVHATEEEIERVVNKILDKKFYDHSGLIYGIGHVVYTKSDPRARLLKNKADELAPMNNKKDLLDFYKKFEGIAITELKKRKGPEFNCCANVDFYSSLIYQLLNIPKDLYTPIFAASRTIGWVAHNIENKLYCNKIIRPAAMYVGDIYDGDK